VCPVFADIISVKGPKLTSSAVTALSMAGRNYLRNWAGTTSALAAPDVGFKKCCMRTGRYDGEPRNHYDS